MVYHICYPRQASTSTYIARLWGGVSFGVKSGLQEQLKYNLALELRITSTTTLQHYFDDSKCTLAHSIFRYQHPAHLQSLNWFNSGGTTRSCVCLPLARSTLFVNSPFFSSYSTWLQLPPSVRQAPDMPKFRTLERQHFSIS